MARKGTTKYMSNLQEKRVANEINGKVVIGSGSIWSMKGDCRNEDYLIECKTTKKDYYVLNVKTWLKIEEEAIKDSLRTPVLCIDTRTANLALIRLHDSEIGEHDLFVKEVSKSLRLYEPCVIKFEDTDIYLLCIEWDEFLELDH